IVESKARPRKTEIIETEPVGDDEIPGVQTFQATGLTTEESKDADARWIKKGKKSTYGYKGHVAVDIETGLVQDMIVTSANIYDGHMLAPLVNELNLETGSEVLADKGYCSADNEAFLKKMSLVSKIMKKKKKNQLADSDLIEHNQAISRYRYRIERSFGALKKHFGWSRSIYVGLQKTWDYLLMGAIAFNIKRTLAILRS
ncbi:MAG: transposase, partial [Candidatus Cloacimonetes bacterium]|nr:transposase [Candidatus Cloacimonadota bacterium]